MSWGRTDGSSALQPDFDDEEDKIIEFPGDYDGDQPDEYSDPADYSEARDYSQPQESSFRRAKDTPDQAAYHHDGATGPKFDTPFDRQNNTRNNLAAAENAAVRNNQPGGNNQNDLLRDIARQERGGQSTPQFNYNNNSSKPGEKNEKQQQGNFVQRHKKGIIGWLIGLTLGGGVFGMGTLVSGPMQFLQMDNLIRDKIGYIMENSVLKRMTRNLSSFARGTNEFSIQGTKMGIIGDRIANSRLGQLGKKGVAFSPNGNQMNINLASNNGLTRYSGNVNFSAAAGSDGALRAAASIAEDLAIDPKLIKVVDGIAEIDVGNMTSFSKRLKTLNKMNNVGRFDIVGRMKTRILNKKLGGVGSVSWFHPIKKMKQYVAKWTKAAKDKFARFLTKKILGSSVERAYKGVIKQGGTEAAARAAGKEVLEKKSKGITGFITKKILKKTVSETGDEIIDAATDVGKAAGAAKLGFVSLIMDLLDILCMIESLDNEFGAYQMLNIVIAAAQESQEMQSTSSQIMSGFENWDRTEDLTSGCFEDELADDQDTDDLECQYLQPMEQLGLISQQKLYNDDIRAVDIEGKATAVDDVTNSAIDEDGNPVEGTTHSGSGYEVDGDGYNNIITGEITSDSVWDSAPIKALTGDIPSDLSITETVPAPLTSVGSKDSFFDKLGSASSLIEAMVEATNVIFENPVGEAICAVMMSMFGGIVVNVIAMIVDAIIAVALSLPSFGTGGAAVAMSATAISIVLIPISIYLTNVMVGDPLDLIDETTTPSRYGSINTYGAIYSSNAQALNSGGRELTNPEVAELWGDQRRYLAEEWAEKSFLAKLFDPSDYRSAANVIARAADFNIADQSWQTQLGNVAKFFGALPKLFGAAINQIGGVSAATDSLPFGGFDFTVPAYGYSKDEQDSLLAGGDNYDIFKNTADVTANDGSILLNYKNRLEKCLAVTVVDAGTGELDVMDNSEGSTWSYIDNRSGGRNFTDGCNDTGDDDWNKVRLYVMDYFNMSADGCYWLSDDESCTATGFGASDDSGSGDGGGGDDIPITTGDAKQLAQAILDSPNITFTGGGFDSKAEMENIAATGYTFVCGTTTNGAPMDPDILRVILGATDQYKIQLGVINQNHCAGGGNHENGYAVDLNGVTRISDNAATSFTAADPVINDFVHYLDEIASANNVRLGMGQSQCGWYSGSFTNIAIFEDECHHLHLDVTPGR